jgi:peptidoglycan/LPS O-acetylase OafA/YrhL
MSVATASSQIVRNSLVIESARGIAAFAVVLFHANIWLLAPDSVSVFQEGFSQWWAMSSWSNRLGFLLFDFGFLGVNLFFVISGFCIHIGNAAANTRQIDRGIFLRRRLVRIYPLYLVMVLMLFLIYGFGAQQWAEKGINLTNLAGHLIFWHYQGPAAASGMGVSVVMWTLAIEMQFYLLYAQFYERILAFGLGRLVLVMLMFELFYRVGSLLIWNDAAWLHPVFAPARFAPARFGEWLLGAWLAQRVVSGRLKQIPAIPAILGGIFLIVISITMGSMLGLDKYNSTDLPAAIGFFMIMHGLLTYEQAGMRVDRPILKWLGERCFSIYLVHATVLLMCSKVTKSLSPHFLELGLPQSATNLSIFALGVASSLFISHIAYILVELPSHKFAKKIRR